MSAESVARTLETLLELHARDHDGGDRLVRAVIRHGRGLAPAQREELTRHLLALVDAEIAGVWPVALEALVRAADPSTARALTGMLGTRDRSPDWSDAVVVALLRLGNPNAVDRCRSWVRDELRLHHLGALPMLAWLYRADREEAIGMAARFYAEVLGDRRAPDERVLGALREQLPRQLEGLLAHSTATPLELVDRVSERDPRAGRALAALIAGYLLAPDAPARLGPRAVSALGAAMRLRAS